MRLNLLNKAVILSGILLVKASKDEVLTQDEIIEKKIEKNADKLSKIFSTENFKLMKILIKRSHKLHTFITPDSIPTDPKDSFDINEESKEELAILKQIGNNPTSFISDKGNKLLAISEAVETWFKELLNTAFFNKRLLTAENRKKDKEPWIEFHSSVDIRKEAICLHILSTEHSGWFLIHLCNSILSRFEAIGAKAVMSEIEASLKAIIESLGEASKKESKYFRQSNPNFEKNVEILLSSTVSQLKGTDLVQLAPNALPEISEEEEVSILDNQKLAQLKKELDILYFGKYWPAIDEILSYYYLFLYVNINNATNNQLSNEDKTRYCEFMDCINALNSISLSIHGVLCMAKYGQSQFKSHSFLSAMTIKDIILHSGDIKNLHQNITAKDGNRIDISSLTLANFNGFKKHFSQSLKFWGNFYHHIRNISYLYYSELTYTISEYLLWANYYPNKETMKKAKEESNPGQNANPVGNGN